MFETPDTTDESNSNTNRGNGNFKRADAYINFYLPAVKRDGEKGRSKLGSIRLYLDKKNEKPLIEWLKADPTRVTRLLATAEIDFQMDEAPAGTGFILEDGTETCNVTGENHSVDEDDDESPESDSEYEDDDEAGMQEHTQA